MSIVQTAFIEIQNLGLDKVRCSLTGAPYATLDSDEVMASLQAEVDHDSKVSADRLVDIWQLKAVTFNSQTLPVLRGVRESALIAFMRDGHAGQVKTLGYLLTRLMFPHIGAEPLPTDVARERMLFATHLYDAALEWDAARTSAYVQQLVTVDSYLAMPHWHTLWAFESTFSKYGIQKAPRKVQETFEDPLRITEDESRIDGVIKYMYELMLHVAERDGGAGRSGNKLSQQIMFIEAEKLGHVRTPDFQKKPVTADQVWKAAWERKVNGDKELRVAHSAIHGKSSGRLANDKFAVGDMASQLESLRLKKIMKEKREASMTREEKLAAMMAGGKDNSGVTRKAPSKAKVNSNMASAFATLTIDPDFAAKMAALVKKD